MLRPKLSPENRIKAQQRRACETITHQIEDKIDSLHQLSSTERVKEYGVFFLLYAFGAFLVHNFEASVFGLLAGIFIMGMALNFLPILLHDGLHGTLCRNSKLNHLVSFLTGLPLLLSASAYHVTHTHHHYELGRKLDYGTYRQHFTNPFFAWAAYFLQLTLGSTLYTLFIPFMALKDGSPVARAMVLLEYLIIVVLAYLAIQFFGTQTLLNFWLYPIIIMSFFTNLRGLASHALGDPENIYLSSRTITSSRLMRFFFLNENFHLEHHLFPTIPSYNLGKTHHLVWDRLPEALYSKSYLSFLGLLWRAALKNDLDPRGIVRPNIDEILA
jgi:fatty acid desaturase